LLLPQDRRGADRDRALGDPDRDRGERLPRRPHRLPDPRLGHAGRRGLDPPDGGLLHLRDRAGAPLRGGRAAPALLAAAPARGARVKLAAAIGFLLLNLYVYHAFAKESVQPPRWTFDRFPLAEGDWVCSRPERMEAAVEANLGVTDYHLCDWERSGSAT